MAKIDGVEIDEVIGKLKSGFGEDELTPAERKAYGVYKSSRRDRLLRTNVGQLSDDELAEAYTYAGERRKKQIETVVMLRAQARAAETNKALQELNNRVQAQGGWLGKMVHNTYRTTKLLALMVELLDQEEKYAEMVPEILQEKEEKPEK